MRSLLILFTLILSSYTIAGGGPHPFQRFVEDFNKIPGYVYFCVDVSCSTQTEIRSAIIMDQLSKCLEFIPETWQYRINTFSDSTEVQKNNWIFPSKEEKAATLAWVAKFYSGTGGYTRLMPALQLAFDEPPGKGVPFLIVVITDAGLDTGDDTKVAALLASQQWQDKDKCILMITVSATKHNLEQFIEMTKSAARMGYKGGAQLLAIEIQE